MIKNIIKFFMFLCGLLLVILLMEWLLAGYTDQQTAEEINRNGQSNLTQTQELQETELARQTLEMYSEMIDRPLFIQGRRPVLDDVVEDSIQDVGKIDDWILIGIYFVADQKTALFSQRNLPKKYLRQLEGDDISGWKLKEIQADKVVLERVGKEKIVMLRKPRPVQIPKTKIKRKPRQPIKPKS